MSALYEYYNTGDNYPHAAFGASIWLAQTFTPSIRHVITSVKLLLYRDGSPGQINVGITAVDGTGNPTGGNLCSGTTDGDTLPQYPNSEWREITLGAGATLVAGTKYAIVAKAIWGNGLNMLEWLSEQNSPAYMGGCLHYTYNGGVAWDSYTNVDLMFEEWGELARDRLLKEDGDSLLKEDDGHILLESTNFLMRLTDMVDTNDAVSKAVSSIQSDTVSIGDSISKAFNLVKSANLSIVDSLLKKVSLNKSETVGITDSIAKTARLVKAEHVAITEGIVKTVRLIKAESLTISDSISKTMGLLKTDLVTVADSISKRIHLHKADLIVIADTFTRVVGYVRMLVDNVAITDSIRKTVSMARADTVGITDAITAVLSGITHLINLFDTVVISDSLSGILWTRTYLRRSISRMQIKGMDIAKMSIKRMGIDKMPLFRWIIRRWTA